ncbi:MAG: hypothetical protein C0404_13035 [Verrucomicrobia bacterium]|nr:hypothetical protein [Verrucomicrobiota bacterium]
MSTTTMNLDKALAGTLSAGQGKGDCKGLCPEPDAGGVALGESVKRYEQLAHAAKAFVFTVIVKDARAVCTIHYPGVFQVTGYNEAEYAARPQLWFDMIYPEDKNIVMQQIAQLLQGKTPPPIKHRIIHKDGLVCWLRNTSVPVFDSKGKLIAYDGLVVDISKTEFVEAEQERQIVELRSALAMVKTLQSLLPICCACKKIRDDKGYWQQIDDYIAGHFSNIGFNHGICPECARRLYPEYYQESNKSA